MLYYCEVYVHIAQSLAVWMHYMRASIIFLADSHACIHTYIPFHHCRLAVLFPMESGSSTGSFAPSVGRQRMRIIASCQNNHIWAWRTRDADILSVDRCRWQMHNINVLASLLYALYSIATVPYHCTCYLFNNCYKYYVCCMISICYCWCIWASVKDQSIMMAMASCTVSLKITCAIIAV